MKPFSESCVQNREPILGVLKAELTSSSRLLEIGSGTGQHAVYFAPEFPQMNWQPSDIEEMLPGINAWLEEASLDNINPPIAIDVSKYNWETNHYDVIYSANAVHIMSWEYVVSLLAGAGITLTSGGKFILYGPFNYNGAYTSESNARFDVWLKQRDLLSGIRDFEALNSLAEDHRMRLVNDYEMPANNRILVWQKT